MKSSVADYRYRIFAVRIEAVGGEVARFVDYPHDLDMVIDSDGNTVTYNVNDGYEFTGIDYTNDMSPTVIDLSGIVGDGIGQLAADEVAAGIWDGSKAYVFATTWKEPTEDEEPLGKFLFGKHSLEDDRYKIEFMHLIDALTQNVGRDYGALCPWTLFDQTLDGDEIPGYRSKCKLSISDYIETGTVTSVTDRSNWTASGITAIADWFANGSVKWTSGDNAGVRSMEVKDNSQTGDVETFLAAPYGIQVGDTFEIVPGCRKRRIEDCRKKFNNAINFGGFDMVPKQSEYSKIGQGGR